MSASAMATVMLAALLGYPAGFLLGLVADERRWGSGKTVVVGLAASVLIVAISTVAAHALVSAS